MNYRKLRGKVFECFATQSECANALGISRTYLNEICNGKKNVNIDLASKFIKVLNLTEKEALEIFFPQLVD